MLFFLVRAMEIAAHYAQEKGIALGSAMVIFDCLAYLINQVTIQSMNTGTHCSWHWHLLKYIAVMSLSLSLHFLVDKQVIWCWLFSRSALDPGYKRFLDHHGGREWNQWS